MEENQAEQESWQEQLTRALAEAQAKAAEADALRAKAAEVDKFQETTITMQRETEGLRRRNVELVEDGEKLQAALKASKENERRLLKQREEEEAKRREEKRQVDLELQELLGEGFAN